MSLFESNYNEEPVQKLPTLLQYIKTRKGKTRPKSFHIAVIWFPNKFPSYSIETDRFRMSVGTKSLMGKAIEAERDTIARLENSVHLTITDDENGLRVYGFTPGSSKGSWVDIGSEPALGIKFIPN